MKHFLLLLASIFTTGLYSQLALDEYYDEGDLLYEDHVYLSGIKTVKLHPVGDDLGMPIIRLNSGEQLLLTFDDLYTDYMNLSYTVIHCNADWTPSNLLKQEYLSTVQEVFIDNYEYSVNALIPYTNYTLALPNNDLRLLKSGNYLLKVFVAGDEEDLVLTRRFMVFEELTSIAGQVKRPSRVEFMNDYQEVDFIINHSAYHIQNPFQDLKVYLMKNGRWDNAITDLKPQFLQNSQLIYQYDKENLFKGGSEYRWFDLKNLQALSMNVARINRDSVYTAYLKPDMPRTISNYTVTFDINGEYTIRRLDAATPYNEADYAYVDFLLKYPEPIESSDVYLFGRFTDWKLLPEYKLKYDYSRGAYHTRALLKQGYYNYLYAVYEPEAREADVTKVEGSHWETGNVYQILAYNREVGARYDRLIGFTQVSSDDLY